MVRNLQKTCRAIFKLNSTKPQTPPNVKKTKCYLERMCEVLFPSVGPTPAGAWGILAKACLAKAVSGSLG